jgi:hypothetical protein
MFFLFDKLLNLPVHFFFLNLPVVGAVDAILHYALIPMVVLHYLNYLLLLVGPNYGKYLANDHLN